MNTREILNAFLLTALVALPLGLAACTTPDYAQSDAATESVAQSQKRLVRVETQVIVPAVFVDVIELTGSVEADNDAVLSAQTAGTVRYLRPLGSLVPEGAVVARIDAGLTDAAVEQARAQVASAQAQYDLARETFERQEPLFRDSVISTLEFESVRAQLNQAEAGLQQTQGLLRQAEEQAGFTRIASPFRGRVEQHFVEVGEQAGPGAPILRVVNTSTVKITTGVPERYAGDIHEGSTVEVRFNNYGVGTYHGTVTFAGSVIDRSSRTFPIEIKLSNPGGDLKPEMIGKVLLTRDRLENALVVPLEAITRDENGTNVYVAVEEGEDKVAERRAVDVGPSYGGRAVVQDGLQPGDELVVAGQTLLTPGDFLEVLSSGQPEKASTPVRTTADTTSS